MNRQYANLKILAKLKNWVDAYPDFRFGQILLASRIVEELDVPTSWKDEFYLESDKLLDRMEGLDNEDY